MHVGNAHALKVPCSRPDQLAGLDTLLGLSWRQRQQQQGGPRVVALVPAHNEAASIARTIESLRRQCRPPDEITVVCDNCMDGTAELSMLNGASIFETVGNTAKKAGALNQVLQLALPQLDHDDLILLMDADSRLSRHWIKTAIQFIGSGKCDAVCGAFYGEPGGGLVGQLQRNEFIRYARTVRRRAQVPVLSGTGTLFKVGVLREIARARGRRIPGRHGDWYSVSSITEDNEITLATKSLGFRCLCPPGCDTFTEVMPTWRDLFKQRIRWQKGALIDLSIHGINRVTTRYWARQAFIYGAFCTSIVVWCLVVTSIARNPSINIAWTIGLFSVSFVERVLTVRKGGLRAVLLALTVLPEMAYDLFRLLYFFRSWYDAVMRRDTAWNHVTGARPDAARHLQRAP
jgi:cellulose synthase/poly-beta-1,6-N-acetylglucosamine synthase-like glycosyltransferase